MKRMWTQKEIEDIASGSAPQIEVDDALSNTSENPVQNKVINEAILGGLPDPLEQEGKVLGLDESGKLSWVEGGGIDEENTFIVLNITKDSYTFDVGIIIPRKATKYNIDDIKDYLHQNHSTSSARLKFTTSFLPFFQCSTNNIGFYADAGLYSADGSTISLYGWVVNAVTLTTDGSTISCASGAGNVGAFSGTITINSIKIQL